MEHLEIERKYLIRMPSAALLASLPSSEIEQVYILSAEGKRERIRRREYPTKTVFTHTAKERLSDLSRVEREEEISEEEYRSLLSAADPKRSVLHKTRYLYRWQDQLFEIDCFPFWNDRALMEIEMSSEEQEIVLPPGIGIIREVSSDGRYTNSAIAREIPREER